VVEFLGPHFYEWSRVVPGEEAAYDCQQGMGDYSENGPAAALEHQVRGSNTTEDRPRSLWVSPHKNVLD